MTDQSTAPTRALIPLILPPSTFTDASDAFLPFALPQAVTVEGRDFKVIGIRRFTVAQVRAIVENFRKNVAIDPSASLDLPLFVDETGQDLPAAVLEAITPDTMDELDRAAADFLPRRFRPAATAPEQATDASISPAGESIAPSS